MCSATIAAVIIAHLRGLRSVHNTGGDETAREPLDTMDPDRRDEAYSALQNLPAIPNQPAYFDRIPGVDIFGPIPIPSPTVIQNVAAPGGGNPIAPRLSTSTEGAREEGIVLAPVRAQALDFSYSEEEDYGCDGEDAAPTEVPECIEEEVAHLRADVWTSITGT